MRIAIVDQDENIYVQYDPDMFRQLLITYTTKYKDIGKAFDQAVADLRKEANRK